MERARRWSRKPLVEHEHLLVGVTEEAGILRPGTEAQPGFSVVDQPLEAEFVLDFVGQVIQATRAALIVSRVLEGVVAQHVAGKHPGVETIVPEAAVYRTQGIIPLLVDRQVIQNVLLLFRFIGLQVEPVFIDGPDADETELRPGAQAGVGFELESVVSRQKGQADHPK